MAFCSKCGNELKGKFCSFCGNNCEIGRTIPLIVRREKRTMGFAISFGVYVDGVKVGSLSNGGTVTYDVCEGMHKVEVKSLEDSVVQDVFVKSDTNSIEMVITLKMGLLAGKAFLKEVNYR